jgi:hypothetical protein
MKKNKLIVYGIVAFLAYYLYDRNRKIKLVSDLKDGANTPFVQEIVDDKYANCKKEWAEKIGSRAKFISSEAKDKSESNYVASCLKNK